MSAPTATTTSAAAPRPTAAVQDPTVAELARQVAEVAGEHAERADNEAEFPAEALAEMRRTKLLGLLVPRAHGGLGGTTADMVEASYLLGRTDMSVAMIFAMHCQQVATLVRHGSKLLNQRLLPEIAAGQRYLASVTTDAGNGGQLLGSSDALEANAGELIVDRFAPVVTGGENADGYLITMRAADAASAVETSLVYADRVQLDLETAGDWQSLGMRASHSVPLRLKGRVPAYHTIGEDGGFRSVAVATFAPMAHLGWSASWLGTAAGALSRVLHLLRSPASRARTDLTSALLLTRLSRARQRLDQVHALLTRTLATVTREPDLSRPSIQLQLNALKISAAEECYRAVDELVDAVGMRHGYLRDSPTRLERALRDLRSAALNYSNDRLHLADGNLVLLDPEVRFA
ncbi:acyl-CoA dehydrogenase family protein [Streptomyces sp. DT171]|uniref:acyl-CoA dehydrogenase family protein n=1 Tax=Streptomyces sp. DT171 TaxID=3416524 RepID=UPI003CFADD6F